MEIPQNCSYLRHNGKVRLLKGPPQSQHLIIEVNIPITSAMLCD